MNTSRKHIRTAAPPRVKKSAPSPSAGLEVQIGVSTSKTSPQQGQGTPISPTLSTKSTIRPHPSGGYTLALPPTASCLHGVITTRTYEGWYPTRTAAKRALHALNHGGTHP